MTRKRLPTQPRLPVEQGGGEPALVLVAIGLPVDHAQPLADLGQEGFQPIGGLEAGLEGFDGPPCRRMPEHQKAQYRISALNSLPFDFVTFQPLSPWK